VVGFLSFDWLNSNPISISDTGLRRNMWTRDKAPGPSINALLQVCKKYVYIS